MASYQRLKTSDGFVTPEPELKLWRAVLSLAADDYIEFYIYHNNGSSAGVFQKGFFGYRVGTYN